jgi:hypothetical protein
MVLKILVDEIAGVGNAKQAQYREYLHLSPLRIYFDDL